MSKTPAVLMRVAYDGTDFHGFARQEGLRTVQGTLEAALTKLFAAPVVVRGASRTDSGVHAHGQIVAFDPPVHGPPADRMHLALWGLLPDDLEAVSSWGAVSIEDGPLHPRRHNLGKHYRYAIRCVRGRDPLSNRYSWSLGVPLDVQAMHRAAQSFIGEHDFSSFRAAGCQAHTPHRRLDAVQVSALPLWPGVEGDPRPPRQGPGLVDARGGRLASGPSGVVIDVHGTAFLMHMVRIMVGSLVEVGQQKQGEDFIARLLANSDRTKAGQTAPARGLTLEEVKWPGIWPPAGMKKIEPPTDDVRDSSI